MDETGNEQHASDAAVPTSDSTPSTPRLTPNKPSSNGEQQEFTNPTINIIQSLTRKKSTSALSTISRETTPPPLPPRPKNLAFLDSRPSTSYSTYSASPARPQLVSKATTQLSYTNTGPQNTESRDDSPSSGASRAKNFFGFGFNNATGDTDDNVSIAPTVDASGYAESNIDEVTGQEETSVRHALGHKFSDQEQESMFLPDPDFDETFAREFDEIEDMAADGSNEGQDLSHICRDRTPADSTLNRENNVAMAVQAKTLPHPLIRRQTHL